jgi:hypothetical protein
MFRPGIMPRLSGGQAAHSGRSAPVRDTPEATAHTAMEASRRLLISTVPVGMLRPVFDGLFRG